MRRKAFKTVAEEKPKVHLVSNSEQKKHFIDWIASAAQIGATIIAIFALLESIRQSKENQILSDKNLKLSEQISLKDSINRIKDQIGDSLKFKEQITIYAKQAAALDKQYFLAKLQFDTSN